MSGVRARLTGAVVLAALALGGAWLLRETAEDCGPATVAEAEAANDRYFEENATADGFRDPAVTGHGIGEEDGSPVLVVTVSDGSTGRPACFDGVPVRYQRGGPFVGH